MAIEAWSDTVVVARLNDDPQFGEDLEALASAVAPARHVVLDFAAVRYINSSNLAALFRLRNRAIQTDRRLVLCGLSTAVWGVFLTTGLDHVFTFSPDVTTALASVQLG